MKKNKGGRPRDPRITELEEKLSVTRRRAAQILKEGGGDDEIRRLRARKLNLECERIEFELEKARTSLEWIPIESFNEAITNFVRSTRMAFITLADLQADSLVTAADEIQVRETLKSMLLKSFIPGVVQLMASGPVDPRLTQTIKEQIQLDFKITDEQVTGWVKATKSKAKAA